MIIITLTFLFTPPSNANQVIRIEIGDKYKNYSQEELRKRVWQLERAVYQLQDKVYELSSKPVPTETWTCYIKSFGKTYSATSSSKTKSEAEVMQKCSEDSHSMHCNKVKCGK